MTACSNVQKVTFKAPATTASPKYPIKVALVLSPELLSYTVGGDRDVYSYPLGDYLRQCVTFVAQNAFQQTTTTGSDPEGLKEAGVDALLTPRMIRMDVRRIGVAWQPRDVLVALEWTLTDRCDRQDCLVGYG